MKDRLTKASIEIRRSNISRYGVFANKNFKKGEIIEECPFLSLKELPPELMDYGFTDNDRKLNTIPFGYGCLYNHAELPNAAWEIDHSHQIIIFRSLKSIFVGDEILTYYPPFRPSQHNIARTARYSLKNFAVFSTRIIFMLVLFFIVKMALFPSSHSSHFQQKNPEYSLSKNINPKQSLITQKYSLMQKRFAQ